ncbi:Toxin ParE3 [Aquamicrobium terrae]
MRLLPIVTSASAEEDLIAIWLHIARENPRAADRMLDAIETRWQQLAVHPFSGPARDDVQPGLRHLTMRDYLILYRVGDDAVEIVRVLHGRRNLAAETLDE